MLCENCNQNVANISYTQIINGVKKEMRLCEECAAKLGIGQMSFSMPIDFSNFFGDILNEEEGFIPTLAIPKELKCDKCNMTYNEFINTGKFGCDNCYNVFEERIDPILKRLHGSNRYSGKKASEFNEENKIENIEKPEENKVDKLKEQLKQLVKEENYEEAAKIRDEIKKLEK